MAKETMFKPNYTITPGIASDLMKIEALRQEIDTLPINSVVLASLRETAELNPFIILLLSKVIV